MTNAVRSHGQQDQIDNSIFGQSGADPFAAAYIQEQMANVGAAKPAAVVTIPAAPSQALYLVEAGNTSAISVTDINQGQLGDCYLLSSVGEEALFHPSAITNMIHDNGNGTETVTLYVDQSGKLPTWGDSSFKAISVLVTNTFSNASVDNGANQDVVKGVKEIWPQVVEKACATLAGGYNAINDGGNPVLAMEELTGKGANYLTPAQLTLASLQQYVAAGDLITFDTSSKSGLADSLVSGHAYMFQKVIGSGGTAAVQLLNPWGTDQPAAISFSQLAKAGIVEIDIGHCS